MKTRFVFFLLIFPQLAALSLSAEKVTELRHTESGWQLLHHGEPYFIKGAVGSLRWDLVSRYGGNSVRSGRIYTELLDEAELYGLTVLFGLPVRPERDGMDYDDPAMVQEQFDRVMEQVRRYKYHPSILFWQLGNELDFVAPFEDPNWEVYDAVNALARAIHAEDPSRPVLTVLGTGKRYKLKIFMERCPDIDLIGVNAYGDIGEIPGWLDEYGFKKPFIVTEWGPIGHWQVPKTARGVPVEQNSTEKALSYAKHYHDPILRHPGRCLGSYVFYWNQKQEQTHTWYGMFDPEWRETAAVDTMRFEWTGRMPDNLAPHIHSFFMDGQVGTDNIEVSKPSIHTARVDAVDPDGDALRYAWEILPENTEFGYGGRGETKPEPVDVITGPADGPEIRFRTPEDGGNYRVVVHIYDEGGNHFSYANIPFFVE